MVLRMLLDIFGMKVSKFSSFYPERDHTRLSDRLCFLFTLLILLLSAVPFPVPFFFWLEFPWDFSEMCCFIGKSTGRGEGLLASSLSKLPPLIDSWPCKYSSCITESTKVHTSTEFVKAVLFSIGTGHSIIFMDLDRLVPLLGSWTCNIPCFSPFLKNQMITPPKFGDAPLSNVVLTNRSWISHVQKVEDFSGKIS